MSFDSAFFDEKVVDKVYILSLIHICYKDLVWDKGKGSAGDRDHTPRIGKYRIRIERVDA